MKRLVGRIQIWWPVAIVLIAAVCVIVSGIWGASFVIGNTDALSNAIRSLQWETMTAGLFGLAGGCLVLVATRQQIEHIKRHAVEQAVDQELSPYFVIVADVRYLIEDVANIGDVTKTWIVSYDRYDRSEDETVSLLITLGKRMNRMFRDESLPLVIRKELCEFQKWIRLLQEKKNEINQVGEEDTIIQIQVITDRFHKVVLDHRARLIRARFGEFEGKGVGVNAGNK